MLAPYKSRLSDHLPCGSGEMCVHTHGSSNAVAKNPKSSPTVERESSFYCQESNHTTWRLTLKAAKTRTMTGCIELTVKAGPKAIRRSTKRDLVIRMDDDLGFRGGTL